MCALKPKVKALRSLGRDAMGWDQRIEYRVSVAASLDVSYSKNRSDGPVSKAAVSDL